MGMRLYYSQFVQREIENLQYEKFETKKVDFTSKDFSFIFDLPSINFFKLKFFGFTNEARM